MNSIFAVRKIYLMLGSACNLKCRHCYQKETKISHLNKAIDTSVWNFLDRISEYHALDEKVRLVFWGGEPLLYWDLIKELVDRYGEKFECGLISNGTLLTEEIVDYFNAHHMLFTVSCDGELTEKVRGINILENDKFCDLFKKLNRRSIGTTIHAYNIDPFSLEKYVEKRVGKTVIFYQYTLECTWGMDKDLYDYDFEKFKLNLEKARSEYLTELASGVENSISQEYLKRGISGVKTRNRIIEEGRPLRWWPECSPMRKTMNIDIKGRVHLCHNAESVLGTVNDSYECLKSNADFLLKNLYKNKIECNDCDVVSLCRHGCPLNTSYRNPGQKICCEAEKIYWRESLEAVKSEGKIFEEIKI